jgi:dipeptidyl aminopeptidase/acylaminoacyl peptidase
MFARSVLVAFVLSSLVARHTHADPRLTSSFIPHPDDRSKRVEYFLKRPSGAGPWPAVLLLHGHQQSPRPGGRDFATWGVLDQLASRGYLAVAVSQPGYGNSTGPADFCGPFTQHAVAAVIAKLRADHEIDGRRLVLEGISRGALVAGLVAAHDSSIGGIVLISGLYDLPEFVSHARSIAARGVVESITAETGGDINALRARSLLYAAQDIRAAALILNGAKDDRTDPAQARRLAAVISQHGGRARAIIYGEYGHQIPPEVRAKEIDPFIADVLRQ